MLTKHLESKFLFFNRFGKLLAIIYSDIFFLPYAFYVLPLTLPVCWIIWYYLSPCSLKKFFFSLFIYLDNFIELFPSSLTLFFNISIWLLSWFNNFRISDIFLVLEFSLFYCLSISAEFSHVFIHREHILLYFIKKS